MLKPSVVQRQIDDIVRFLVEIGLSSDQNFSVRRDSGREVVEVTFPNADAISVALKNSSYNEIYDQLTAARAYTVRLPDGALLQMMYLFKADRIQQHRLAFFPAPDLTEFQNDPELYLADEVFAEVVAKSIVPFPIRFDFDNRSGVSKPILHPSSHLTLGQYQNCRIPVSAALTPYWFTNFVLRNFYHTAFYQFADDLPDRAKECFQESILPAERSVVHMMIPVP